MFLKVIFKPKTVIFNKIFSINFRTSYCNNNYIYMSTCIQSTRLYSSNVTHITNDEKQFKLKNVLLIRKITRYEYERQLLSPISQNEFKDKVG